MYLFSNALQALWHIMLPDILNKWIFDWAAVIFFCSLECDLPTILWKYVSVLWSLTFKISCYFILYKVLHLNLDYFFFQSWGIHIQVTSFVLQSLWNTHFFVQKWDCIQYEAMWKNFKMKRWKQETIQSSFIYFIFLFLLLWGKIERNSLKWLTGS